MKRQNNGKCRYNTFEEIKKTSKYGIEFWYARDLQVALEYSSWDKFKRVVKKSMLACENVGQRAKDHFSQVGKMVKIGSSGKRRILDYKLSRYACYLIVQNGDPSKSVIAQGQTYFAIQTRRQELSEDESFQQMKEDERRLFLRNEMKKHNKQLVRVAQTAGVETQIDFAIFQNHGYKGLYGGLDAKSIHKRKELKKSQQILDNMGSTELAANLFRATQTEEKLRREKVQNKECANKTHFNVGKKVRQTIEELGGTMPEDLPTPNEDIKKIEKKVKTKNSLDHKNEEKFIEGKEEEE